MHRGCVQGRRGRGGAGQFLASVGSQEPAAAGRDAGAGHPRPLGSVRPLWASGPSQLRAGPRGVKLPQQCKLDVINPFHQLQIYLLNPIKNMNMQMKTFLNSHFQGLGIGV